jgi:hypothetical protein
MGSAHYKFCICTGQHKFINKARDTRAHQIRPLQRTYFMTDVVEDTTLVRNVIRSCLQWIQKKALHSPFLLVNVYKERRIENGGF